MVRKCTTCCSIYIKLHFTTPCIYVSCETHNSFPTFPLNTWSDWSFQLRSNVFSVRYELKFICNSDKCRSPKGFTIEKYISVQIFPLFIGHKYYVDYIHSTARHHNRGLKLTNKSLEMCQLGNDSLLQWHIAFFSLSCTSCDVMGNFTPYWKCFIVNRYQNIQHSYSKIIQSHKIMYTFIFIYPTCFDITASSSAG